MALARWTRSALVDVAAVAGLVVAADGAQAFDQGDGTSPLTDPLFPDDPQPLCTPDSEVFQLCSQCHGEVSYSLFNDWRRVCTCEVETPVGGVAPPWNER